MPLITIRDPGTSTAAAAWKAADEGSPGTCSVPSPSSSCGATVTRSPARSTCTPAAASMPLGVIARGLRLDHRRRTGRQQPGQQHAGLDLRRRDRQLVLDALQRAADHRERREAAVGRLEPPAHAAERLGHAVDRAAPDRRVAVERPAAALLAREPARQQPHQRAGVADVDRRARRRRAQACAAHHELGVAALDERAQRLDGGERRVRVGGVEVARDRHRLVAHRREQRRAVRERLVGRRDQRSAQRAVGGEADVHGRDTVSPRPSTSTCASSARCAPATQRAIDPEARSAVG